MLVAVVDRSGWTVAPTKAMAGLRCCWHASDNSSCMASPCSCNATCPSAAAAECAFPSKEHAMHPCCLSLTQEQIQSLTRITQESLPRSSAWLCAAGGCAHCCSMVAKYCRSDNCTDMQLVYVSTWRACLMIGAMFCPICCHQ